jgi:hypothetical protein
MFGLRTLRWKSTLTPSGLGALFDLPSDPSEQHNLMGERLDTYVGLSLLLSDRVARPPSVAASAERAEITREDREMLRALGYVDGDEEH